MQTEDRCGARIFERALFDHQCRAATLTRRGPLLGRLKDEFDGPANLLSHFTENLGNTELDGQMDIVTARMFDSLFYRFVRNIDRFLDGQGIHIRAYCDDRSGLFPLEESNNPVPADSGLEIIEAERSQFFGYHARRAFFTIR